MGDVASPFTDLSSAFPTHNLTLISLREQLFLPIRIGPFWCFPTGKLTKPGWFKGGTPPHVPPYCQHLISHILKNCKMGGSRNYLFILPNDSGNQALMKRRAQSCHAMPNTYMTKSNWLWRKITSDARMHFTSISHLSVPLQLRSASIYPTRQLFNHHPLWNFSWDMPLYCSLLLI